MVRNKLPNRRHGITETVTHVSATGNTHKFDVTFGFDDVGIREVFLHGGKEGTDLQAILTDACIAISMLLQHGETCQTLNHSFGENRAEGSILGPASSPLGTIVRAGAKLEVRAIALAEEPAI